MPMPRSEEERRTAAAATVARVLEQISGVRAADVDYEMGDDGVINVRVIVEQGVTEMLFVISNEDALISARLIELQV